MACFWGKFDEKRKLLAILYFFILILIREEKSKGKFTKCKGKFTFYFIKNIGCKN